MPKNLSYLHGISRNEMTRRYTPITTEAARAATATAKVGKIPSKFIEIDSKNVNARVYEYKMKM